MKAGYSSSPVINLLIINKTGFSVFTGGPLFEFLSPGIHPKNGRKQRLSLFFLRLKD